MTPEEFHKKLKVIYAKDARAGLDPEYNHDESDTLMEDLLIELGYKKGIAYLRDQVRWYS